MEDSLPVTSMEVTVEKFNPWKDSLITGLFMIILGIIMIWLKSESLNWILIIGGVLCLISGAVMIYGAMKTKFGPTLMMGAILVVLGIALIVLTNLFGDLLMVFLAIGLIVMGIVALFGTGGGFAVAKGSKVLSVIVGVLLIVVGIYAMLNLNDTKDIVMIIIGALLLVSGILELVECYQLRKVSA